MARILDLKYRGKRLEARFYCCRFSSCHAFCFLCSRCPLARVVHRVERGRHGDTELLLGCFNRPFPSVTRVRGGRGA